MQTNRNLARNRRHHSVCRAGPCGAEPEPWRRLASGLRQFPTEGETRSAGEPLDMLGALSLSKRRRPCIRLHRPGFAFPSVHSAPSVAICRSITRSTAGPSNGLLRRRGRRRSNEDIPDCASGLEPLPPSPLACLRIALWSQARRTQRSALQAGATRMSPVNPALPPRTAPAGSPRAKHPR